MAPLGPLLLGLIVLVGHVWTFRKEFYDISKTLEYFLMSVEFAVFQFNQESEDEFAYNLQWIRRSQRKRNSHMYLMDVELGRTICRKHEEDLENCPLQEGPGEKKLRCTFLVETLPWESKFILLNSTCVEQ
ncbi:probable cystatin-16 [Dasypus novemcinctus]|uniref:probable cystatin-16 n=1 Tax=Dasypus novemcinctus TaxID=9361 RepID=UPI000328D8FD|nr:probable cystatin-16 [Dasypus novemcinctus]